MAFGCSCKPHFLRILLGRSKTTSAQYVSSRARDPTFEKLMRQYKNLLKVVAVQDLILASPQLSVSLPLLSRLSQRLHLNRGPVSFLRKYPHIFVLFYDNTTNTLSCRLTPTASLVSAEESFASSSSIPFAVNRLSCLLSISSSKSLPLRAVFRIWRELGLPDDFEDSVIAQNPTLFALSPSPLERNTHLLKLIRNPYCPPTAAVETWRQQMLLNSSSSSSNSSALEESELQSGFKHSYPLEELLGLRREAWENFPIDTNEFYTGGGSLLGSCNENPNLYLPFSSVEGYATSIEAGFNSNEVYYPFGDGFSVNDIDLSSKNHDSVPFLIQEDCPSVLDENPCLLGEGGSLHNLEEQKCKVELANEAKIPVFDVSTCLGRKNRVKRVEGQPSKNLMAERRRRKRLNDRLSMLRSVVPKISKMDRTSILGDTIDYMKELLDRINRLQEEIKVGEDKMNLLNIFEALKPNDILVRNTPKFSVERRNTDTRLDVCCAAKPGLLLSTVKTLEALGLEIQQCVISCFNDFGMQASCTEEMEQREIVSSEDIKQALFRNAGYGGRCI